MYTSVDEGRFSIRAVNGKPVAISFFRAFDVRSTSLIFSGFSTGLSQSQVARNYYSREAEKLVGEGYVIFSLKYANELVTATVHAGCVKSVIDWVETTSLATLPRLYIGLGVQPDLSQVVQCFTLRDAKTEIVKFHHGLAFPDLEVLEGIGEPFWGLESLVKAPKGVMKNAGPKFR